MLAKGWKIEPNWYHKSCCISHPVLDSVPFDSRCCAIAVDVLYSELTIEMFKI